MLMEGRFYPKDGNITLHRNVGIWLVVDVVPHSGRTKLLTIKFYTSRFTLFFLITSSLFYPSLSVSVFIFFTQLCSSISIFTRYSNLCSFLSYFVFLYIPTSPLYVPLISVFITSFISFLHQFYNMLRLNLLAQA